MFDYWKGMIMNLTDFYEVYPDEEACEHAHRFPCPDKSCRNQSDS